MASNETFDEYVDQCFEGNFTGIFAASALNDMLVALGFAKEAPLLDFLSQNKNAVLTMLDFIQQEVINNPEWEAKLKAQLNPVND